MKKPKKCKKCGIEMYRDDRGEWFCPDCIIEEIEPDFLDEKQVSRGELKRPYIKTLLHKMLVKEAENER